MRGIVSFIVCFLLILSMVTTSVFAAPAFVDMEIGDDVYRYNYGLLFNSKYRQSFQQDFFLNAFLQGGKIVIQDFDSTVGDIYVDYDDTFVNSRGYLATVSLIRQGIVPQAIPLTPTKEVKLIGGVVTIVDVAPTKVALSSIKVYNGEIALTFDGNPPAGLSLNDFIVTAKLNDMEYTLVNMSYDGNICFTPIVKKAFPQTLEVIIAKAPASNLLKDFSPVSGTVLIEANQAPPAPNVAADDDNDVIIDIDENMEYSFDGTNWISYDPSTPPDLSGDKTIMVRLKETEFYPASEAATLSFTAAVTGPTGTYHILNMHSMRTDFSVIIENVPNANYYMVLSRGKEVETYCKPITEIFTSMPMVFNDINQLEVRVYGDPAGLNEVARFKLEGSPTDGRLVYIEQ